MTPTVGFVVTDIHMGLQHDGLNEVIKTHKRRNALFARAMKDRNKLVLFLNTAKTRAKLFSEDGAVIGYLRLPGNHKLTETTLDLIPATFGGSLEYAQAAKRALKTLFEMERSHESDQRKFA